MHNLDRTTNEYEFEYEGEFEGEFEFEGGFEFEGEHEGEAYEMELATELLGVQNEMELEQFLGKLISGAAKGISKFAKSPIGKGLLGGLKTIAKKALPIAGSALGNLVVPGLGGAIGGKLGSMASSMFELEMEGMSHEDREFEVARRFVRFANAAAQNAAQHASSAASPSSVINHSLKEAAYEYAPGLLRKRGTSSDAYSSSSNAGRRGSMSATSGTWARRGNSIIIYGA